MNSSDSSHLQQEMPSFISSDVTDSDYFFADSNPSIESSFSIVCGGFESCSDEYSVERDEFDYFALEYIASGECRLVLKEKEFELSAGSIFCYGPSTPHRIEKKGQSTLNKFFVDFVGSEVPPLINNLFLDKLSPYKIADLRIMNDLFFQVMDAGKSGGGNAQHRLKLLLELIVAQTEAKAVDIVEFQSYGYQTYTRFLSHLEKRFKEVRSISELSEMCCVSAGYMSRVVKKYSGEKPSDMLTRYKLNHAAELILKNNLMVKEAGFAVGIDDPYYFSRLFKKHYGLSPQNFKLSVNR